MRGLLCGNQLKAESNRKLAIKYMTRRLKYTQLERILMNHILKILHKSQDLGCHLSMRRVTHLKVKGSIFIRAYLIRKEQLSKVQKLFLIATESSMKLNKISSSMRLQWTPKPKMSTIQTTHSPLRDAKMQYSKQLWSIVSGKKSVIRWPQLRWNVARKMWTSLSKWHVLYTRKTHLFTMLPWKNRWVVITSLT